MFFKHALARMNLKSYCSLVIFREVCCWHGMNRNPEYDESCNYKMQIVNNTIIWYTEHIK